MRILYCLFLALVLLVNQTYSANKLLVESLEKFAQSIYNLSGLLRNPSIINNDLQQIIELFEQSSADKKKEMIAYLKDTDLQAVQDVTYKNATLDYIKLINRNLKNTLINDDWHTDQ